MRVTFLTHYPGRGGSTVFLDQLRRFLDGCGHHTEVVCGQDADAPLLDRYHVVQSVPHREWHLRRSCYLEAIQRTAPDVVYAISGSEEFDILRFLKLPRVHHIFSLERHAWMDIPRLIRQSAPCTELFTANTPDVLDDIAPLTAHGQSQQRIAPYRIDETWFAQEPPAESDRVRVCFCGRLEPFQKRADWLAKIIPHAHRRGLPIEWHVIGDGPSADGIRRRVEDSGAAVKFHGWLNANQMRAVYRQADLFFLCSRWEGLPVSMVEAMACGLAAMVPRMPGGSAHLLESSACGWIYRATAPRAAVDALELACAERSLLEQKKRHALQRVRQEFGPETVDRQLTELEAALQCLAFNGHAEDPRSAAPLRRISPLRFLFQRIPLLLARQTP